MKISLISALAVTASLASASAIPADVSAANPLQKRYPDYCNHPTIRDGTSAGLKRCIDHLFSIGDRWCEIGTPTERGMHVDMCTEPNHDVPGGKTIVRASAMAKGTPVWGYERSKCRDIAIALQPILADCKNTNCPGKSYCGVGGTRYANGNGNIRLYVTGTGNW